MSRERSSSRWSTRLRRSSWPTGRTRPVPGWRPPGIGARGGLVLAARLAGDDLGLSGGRIELGRRRPLRRRLQPVVVVVLVLARDRVLELAHARPELPAQAGEPLRAEDDENDEEDDPQLEGSDARHTRKCTAEWARADQGERRRASSVREARRRKARGPDGR